MPRHASHYHNRAKPPAVDAASVLGRAKGMLAQRVQLGQSAREPTPLIPELSPVRSARILAVIVLLGALAAAAALFWPRGAKISESEAFTAPGLQPLTIAGAQAEFWRLTPALLLVVYEAFAETQEEAIYDTLASVTDAEALEYLYLQRVGAMKSGGLDEADQTIHEIKLLRAQAARKGQALGIDATWQVIGTVGHAEHLHVRGNTYSATLTVAPTDGAWRITDFELLTVNRDAAGETFAVEQEQ